MLKRIKKWWIKNCGYGMEGHVYNNLNSVLRGKWGEITIGDNLVIKKDMFATQVFWAGVTVYKYDHLINQLAVYRYGAWVKLLEDKVQQLIKQTQQDCKLSFTDLEE